MQAHGGALSNQGLAGKRVGLGGKAGKSIPRMGKAGVLEAERAKEIWGESKVHVGEEDEEREVRPASKGFEWQPREFRVYCVGTSGPSFSPKGWGKESWLSFWGSQERGCFQNWRQGCSCCEARTEPGKAQSLFLLVLWDCSVGCESQPLLFTALTPRNQAVP